MYLSSSSSSIYQSSICRLNSIQLSTDSTKGPKIGHTTQWKTCFHSCLVYNFVSTNFPHHFITKYRIKWQLFQIHFSQWRGQIKLYAEVEMWCKHHGKWFDHVNYCLNRVDTSWNWPNMYATYLCTSWSISYILISSRKINFSPHK